MEVIIVVGMLLTIWIVVRLTRGWGGPGYGYGYYGRGFRHRGEYYRYRSYHYHHRRQSWMEFFMVLVLLFLISGLLYTNYLIR